MTFSISTVKPIKETRNFQILSTAKKSHRDLEQAISAARKSPVRSDNLLFVNDEDGWPHAIGVPVASGTAFITDEVSEASSSEMGIPQKLATIKDYGNASRTQDVIAAWNHIQDPRTLLVYAQKIANTRLVALATLECAKTAISHSPNRDSRIESAIGDIDKYLSGELDGQTVKKSLGWMKAYEEVKNPATRAMRGAVYTLLDPVGSNIAYSVYSSAKAMSEFTGGSVEAQYPVLAEAVRGYITLVDISLPLLAISRG